MSRFACGLPAVVFAGICLLGTLIAPAPLEGQDRGAATATGPRAGSARAPEDPMARAAHVRRRAELTSRRVAALLDLARRERHLPRVHCLDDVLSQINSTVRSIDLRTDRLAQAIRRRDARSRGHEITVLTVLEGRRGELEAEARMCVGDTPVTGTRTVVTVTVDRSVPDEDPTRLGSRRPGLPWVPPPASPSL